LADVWTSFYSDAGEPLVLLTLETDRLTSPWREDPVGDTTYPHVYGPINTSAVLRVQPLDDHGRTGSFMGMFVQEMLLRVGLFVVAMLLAFAGSAVGAATDREWGAFAGALTGLALGVAVMVAVLRRRG
jgi:hypothetical protein